MRMLGSSGGGGGGGACRPEFVCHTLISTCGAPTMMPSFVSKFAETQIVQFIV